MIVDDINACRQRTSTHGLQVGKSLYDFVSGELPSGLGIGPPEFYITLDQARIIIAGAFEFARGRELKALRVAVLDAGGHLIAFERQDGVTDRRFEIAFAKAHEAISLGVNSQTLGEMAIERPHFIAGATSAIGGDLVSVAGGVITVDQAGSGPEPSVFGRHV